MCLQLQHGQPPSNATQGFNAVLVLRVPAWDPHFTLQHQKTSVDKFGLEAAQLLGRMGLAIEAGSKDGAPGL